MNSNIEKIIKAYSDKQFEYEEFLNGVVFFFQRHPSLNKTPLPVIHSIKWRVKNPDHLADKIQRKLAKGEIVTDENVFTEITDLVGVRILHLYQDQFKSIHDAIIKKVNDGDWVLAEGPKAYTWDPESEAYYKSLDIETELRDTYYTSIHYLIKPNQRNVVCCEIQVRTLFEEIWGEIDHSLNYPHKTESLACKEQLRVLSKLVSTGTRLADSIFRTHQDYLEQIK